MASAANVNSKSVDQLPIARFGRARHTFCSWVNGSGLPSNASCIRWHMEPPQIRNASEPDIPFAHEHSGGHSAGNASESFRESACELRVSVCIRINEQTDS